MLGFKNRRNHGAKLVIRNEKRCVKNNKGV